MAEIDAVWHGVSWVNTGAGAVSVGRRVSRLGTAARRSIFGAEDYAIDGRGKEQRLDWIEPPEPQSDADHRT